MTDFEIVDSSFTAIIDAPLETIELPGWVFSLPGLMFNVADSIDGSVIDAAVSGLGIEPFLMVEEISHRVANEYAGAIAAINVEALRIADADARAALRRTSNKLHAFAEAHRVLQAPATGANMALGAYLDRVCAALSEATLRERGVRLILVEDVVTLPAKRCWRVALIVAELITNAVRHGFDDSGGMIIVEVRQHGGDVICVVADNGGCAPNPPPSRGRRVVERLARELSGNVRWLFGPRGVAATLAFPASQDLADVFAGGAPQPEPSQP